MKRQTLTFVILAVVVVFLMFSPLWLLRGGEFGGADEKATEVITEVQPEYEPWFNVIWEPPSGEVESLLFALQAALGAGFVGYFLGYQKAKQEIAGRAKEAESANRISWSLKR